MAEKRVKLTKSEYILGGADSLVNGLKAAINIWSGLVHTVFLKLSPENYVKLSGYLVVIQILVIPLGYLVARFADRVKNVKRLAFVAYIFTSFFPIALAFPIAYFFPGISDGIKIMYIVAFNFINSAVSLVNSSAWQILDIRLTPNDKDRSYFFSLRNVIGGAISSLGAPATWIAIFLFKGLVPYELNTDAANAHFYFYGTVLFTLIAMPVTLYYLKVRRVRIETSPREKPENILTIAKAMVKNKPLWLRRLSMIITAWGGLSGTAYAILVSKYYYGISISLLGFTFVPDVPTLLLVFSCTQTIPAMLSIPVALWLRKKIADKNLITATLIYSAIGAVLGYLFLSDTFFTTTLMQRFFIHLAAYGWGGVIFGFNICGNILDLELIDYMEWQSGQRNECTYNFIVDNINKVLTLPISYFAARLLVSTGFKTDDDSMITEEATRRGIVALAVLVPGIFNFLGSIPLFFYDFYGDKRKHIMEELTLRRGGAAVSGTETAASSIFPGDFNLYA